MCPSVLLSFSNSRSSHPLGLFGTFRQLNSVMQNIMKSSRNRHYKCMISDDENRTMCQIGDYWKNVRLDKHRNWEKSLLSKAYIYIFLKLGRKFQNSMLKKFALSLQQFLKTKLDSPLLDNKKMCLKSMFHRHDKSFSWKIVLFARYYNIIHISQWVIHRITLLRCYKRVVAPNDLCN